jgi:signal transduction histidine kinase
LDAEAHDTVSPSPETSLRRTAADARGGSDGSGGFLSRASRMLAESVGYEGTLSAVAHMALPYLGSWCIVDVVEPDGSLRRLAIVHPDPTKRVRTHRLETSWPPQRDDPLGAPRVMRTRRSEVIPAVPDEMLVAVARSEQNLRDLRALAIGSVLTVPLLARRQVLGAITFVSAETGHQYDEGDVALAEDLAARCAMALDNARLYSVAEEARSTSAQMNERLILASLRDQDLADAARSANETKSRFLAAMSHEFRTPLHAIMGYTSLIEEELAGPVTPRQIEFLAKIQAGTRHLVGLIEDVLDLAKVEAGQMRIERRAASVTEAIGEACALMEPQAAAAGVALGSAPPRRADACYLGDPERVRQILVNLVSNAVKFSDLGGRVTVTVGQATEPDPGANLPGEGPWVLIGVEDTGIGIGAEDATRIFDPFVQGRKGRGRSGEGLGTGLGLAISRELARRMDGDLTLTSVEGKGSSFTLWLPAGGETGREEGAERFRRASDA